MEKQTNSKQWLVAYVRLFHEKKTSERLTQMGIENYVPIQKEVRQWSDRRKTVERVVIPMMIFVHVTTEERSLVVNLPAVSRYMVLRGTSSPAVIPDTQMERFRFMLDFSDETVSLSNELFSPGEQVRVVKGPLSGLEGELITLEGKSKVLVRLDMLGCAQVDIPIGYIEKIKAAK